MQTVVIAMFGSVGLWTAIAEITKAIIARKKKPDPISELVLGLAYIEICNTGRKYVMSGSIDFEERENFRKYLYNPYKAAGGDGIAESIMKQVDALPLKKEEQS